MSTRVRLVAPPATGDPENLVNRVGVMLKVIVMDLQLEEEHELLFPILDEDDKCEHIYL